MKALTVRELHDLLLRHDSPEHLVPRGFDHAVERAGVAAFAAAVSSATGDQTLVEDPNLHLGGPLFTRVAVFSRKTLDKTATIYFSAFGRLITLDSAQPYHLLAIMQAARQSPYLFVPPFILQLPYDGRHPSFKGRRWHDRYFAS